LKRCSVVCDTSKGIYRCELQLPDDATLEGALSAARVQLGEAAVDWQHAATGVYGKVRSRSFVWCDGDRIELYRPLQLDPRMKRRERAAPRPKALKGSLK
jgi:putative ubiquitin-RnfH superfamily antitoxin RatB of RatAB toxin-antitoxin module